MLEKQPPMLYIRRDGEGMPQHMDLEPEIFGLRARGVDWPVDPVQKENWAKRFGFPIVPDFAATVHAVTGGQLPTAIGDLDTFDGTPSQEDALRGYIVLSRVEKADNILIAQPFSPTLFTQGPLESAELLLEVLRGNVPKDDLEARWDGIEANWKQRKPRLGDHRWQCGGCDASKPWVSYVPALAGSDMNAGIDRYILEPGAWRLCQTCRLHGPDRRADAAEDDEADGRYPCTECGETKLPKYFENTALKLQLECGDNPQLVCLACDSLYLKKYAGRSYRCTGCDKDRDFDGTRRGRGAANASVHIVTSARRRLPSQSLRQQLRTSAGNVAGSDCWGVPLVG